MIGSGAVDGRVVDAHHHLINLEALEYPWIRRRSPALEALLENYYDIAHDYDIGDYLSEVAPARLLKSVACEFGAADGVAEAQWIQRCSDDRGFPHAFIAPVDLTSSSLDDVLARYTELAVVRAVRQPLYWARDPLRRLGARPDYLTDREWWRGFERVAEHEFVWDLLVYDDQLAPFSALGAGKGCRRLLGPGWCDLEEFEDAALCVGEAVELDAGVGVGEAESLEDAEHVTSGGFR